MGSQKRTPQEWEELVKQQQRSGQPQEAWCKARDINLNTLRSYIVRANKANSQGANKPVSPEEPANTKTTLPPISWVTVSKAATRKYNTTPEPKHSKQPRSRLHIEIGMSHITADSRYPVKKLAALCRELSGTC